MKFIFHKKNQFFNRREMQMNITNYSKKSDSDKIQKALEYRNIMTKTEIFLCANFWYILMLIQLKFLTWIKRFESDFLLMSIDGNFFRSPGIFTKNCDKEFLSSILSTRAFRTLVKMFQTSSVLAIFRKIYHLAAKTKKIEEWNLFFVCLHFTIRVREVYWSVKVSVSITDKGNHSK